MFKLLNQIFHATWRTVWYLIATAVILLAVAFSAARAFLPQAEQYRSEIIAELSAYVGQPVDIARLDAEWHGMEPSLVLQQVRLLDPDGKQTVLALKRVSLGFSLYRSLLHWQPVFSSIRLVGASLVVVRDEQGSISLAGLTQEGGGETHVDEFAAWLLAQGAVSLEGSSVTWRDKLGGRTLQVTNANILLRNEDERHLLDVSVRLPQHLGKNLQVSLAMEGDPLEPEGRQTQVYFHASEVNLARLFAPQNVAGVDASIGKGSFSVWGDWADGELQRLQGDVDLRDVRFSRLQKEQDESARLASVMSGASKREIHLGQLSSQFRWQREDEGWRFEAGDLVLARGDNYWLPASVALRYAAEEERPQSFSADVSYLRVEDVHALLDLFRAGNKGLREVMQQMQPRGEIYDAHVSWSAAGGMDEGEPMRYQAYAILRDLGVNAWRGVPRVDKVNGQLWLDQAGGVAAVSQAGGELDFPGLFRWPLRIGAFTGMVAWEMGADGWRVSGRELQVDDPAIKAQASLDVSSGEAGGSPHLSVVAHFKDGDASQVARYLPVGIMPKTSVQWLDASIAEGRIVSGGTLIHGPIREFPFVKHNGRFETRFHVEEGVLNYAPGWPSIRDMAADVLFQGKGLAVKASYGRILDSDIQWAEAGIVDMSQKPLPLRVRGEVQGSTQDKLDYLITSPQLHDSFGQHLTGLHTTGQSLLNLDLFLPIGAAAETEVTGWVDLDDNTLDISPLGEVLTQVNGVMHFSHEGLEAKSISTNLLGQAAQLNIVTERRDGRGMIQVKALGTMDAPSLAERYLPGVYELVHGSSDLAVSLHIPLGASDQGATRLRVASGLKGIAVDMPPPLRKGVDEDFPLHLEMDFPARQSPLLRFNYGDALTGIMALSAQGVERGELRFGGGSVNLPPSEGLRLVGWLERFDLSSWRGLWHGAEEGHDSLAWLHSVDMAAQEAEVFGQVLNNPKLKLEKVGGQFRASIESPEVAGEVNLPQGPGTIKADMQHMYLVSPELGGEALDPRDIPGLSIAIQDLRFDDRQFGRLKLETSRTAEGMRLEQLELKPKSTVITLQGGWFVDGQEQHSQIEMQLKTKNAGRTLKSIGYVGTIEGGKGTANMSLAWPGSFADVSAETISGEFALHLTDGQLLDIDPGTGGRIFGMLSIQTLPRRLFLDFSDVFSKGFGFDVIEGDFQIDAGDAYTSNLYMDGPAARVDIAGRTGLAQQDYDQLVTVTPHISESLPVLGALAATPQIGAAILFVQKLLQPGIRDATRNQYTITGSWQKPKIRKIKKKKPKSQANAFDE